MSFLWLSLTNRRNQKVFLDCLFVEVDVHGNVLVVRLTIRLFLFRPACDRNKKPRCWIHAFAHPGYLLCAGHCLDIFKVVGLRAPENDCIYVTVNIAHRSEYSRPHSKRVLEQKPAKSPMRLLQTEKDPCFGPLTTDFDLADLLAQCL